MEQNHPFDEKQAEINELNLLTRKGISFKVNRRFSKSKTRTFYINHPPVGVMDRLSAEFIRLDMDEELLQAQNLESIKEAKRTVGRHAHRLARIVAIAVLNNSPFYRFLVGPLSAYFYMRVDSAMLLQLAMIINQQNNYADFINCIRYLSSQPRTTKPQTDQTGPQLVQDQDESED